MTHNNLKSLGGRSGSSSCKMFVSVFTAFCVSSSSLTPEQKDTHSWHEALSLLTPSYCELLVVLSQTLTERSGRKRLTSGSILSRGTRGEALREVLVSSPRLSLTDRRRRSRDMQRLEIYVYILASYMKPRRRRRRRMNSMFWTAAPVLLLYLHYPGYIEHDVTSLH